MNVGRALEPMISDAAGMLNPRDLFRQGPEALMRNPNPKDVLERGAVKSELAFS